MDNLLRLLQSQSYSSAPPSPGTPSAWVPGPGAPPPANLQLQNILRSLNADHYHHEDVEPGLASSLGRVGPICEDAELQWVLKELEAEQRALEAQLLADRARVARNVELEIATAKILDLAPASRADKLLECDRGMFTAMADLRHRQEARLRSLRVLEGLSDRQLSAIVETVLAFSEA